ncbi:MAG: 3-hydroxyacyl-CoA dehydrogenase NAD-binding domain-containing protein [Alphaproteobacteria bacterium]
MSISRVAVLGAGVMGGGIAAHVANAGVPVLLLDVVPAGAASRNAVAEGALKRLLAADPAPFMTRRAAGLVTPGNVEDDLEKLVECDWILEAVIERLDVKQDLYRRVQAVRRPGSIVSSNTSTLPLTKLIDGLPIDFGRDFLITHFFNPPRYMRLLEVVAGPATRRDAVDELGQFADVVLGKGVVTCHDTPGFIANRIGTFWIQCAFSEALDLGLTVEQADAVMSRPLGIPKTGVFGLMDLVGIDLMPHVHRNLVESLPPMDAYRSLRHDAALVERMIADGYTGRKGKGGFYRLNTDGGGRVKEARDLATGAYKPATKPVLESLEAAETRGLEALLSHPDKGGRYARRVMTRTLAYAASLVPEIADDVHAVDRAMHLGYNWTHGPFELIDRLGPAVLASMLAEDGLEVPPLVARAAEAAGFYRVEEGRRGFLSLTDGYTPVKRPDGVLLLEDVKLRSEPVTANASASLWDVGDGALCLEFHTKMNTVDQDVLAMIQKAVRRVEKGHKALIIYNEGEHFCAGANLGLALFAANTALWPVIEDMVAEGQKTLKALKYAPFPVVAAPSGLALGGGCEILLHCDAVEAHAESYIGLVETGVGVVPGWGGCTNMLARFAADPNAPRGPMPPVAKAFETIGMAKVARSAFEARELGFLRPTDRITFNRDRLLADAKARALGLVADYRPPEPVELVLPGPTGKAALGLALRDLKAKGMLTPHDEVVADALADVLTGGPECDLTEPVGEDAVMALERDAFMRLVRTDPTLARMEHTLETGKPLRN